MAKAKSSPKKEGKETRQRTWTCIVYPESAPENWRDLLDEQHIAYIVSPLHDRDINPDGEPKKPHWHVVLAYGSLKSYEQVKAITDAITAPRPEPCASLRGMIRYLVHMDNPDKAQYDKSQIEAHGIEIGDALRSSEQSRQNVVREMCRWCAENKVIYFCDLLQYAMDNEPDWWDALTSNSAYIMDKYLKSIAYKIDREEARGHV